MFRFLAFHSRHPASQASSDILAAMKEIASRDGLEWKNIYSLNGLEVWLTGDRRNQMEAKVLPDGGVILGRVLSKANGFPDWNPCSLKNAAGSENFTRWSDWLVENVWGNYVAFFLAENNGGLSVFRDPVGLLPCYRVKWRGGNIFTSNIEVLRSFPQVNFKVNLDRLHGNIVLPLVCKKESCLEGVAKVLPGECLHLKREERRTFHWDPLEIGRGGIHLQIDDAAVFMRDILNNVVGALARPYKNILHSLGGLDSSIVLSCLSSARESHNLTCANLFSKSLVGDERHFARAMAAHSGVPLIEQQLDPERVDLEIWRQQEMGSSPPIMFDSVTQSGGIRSIAEEVGADAICSGVLGDAVLYEWPQVFPALDYVAERNAFSNYWRIALESSQVGGVSVWKTILKMIREKFRPENCYDTLTSYLDLSNSTFFIDRDLNPNSISLDRLHPMLRPDEEYPKGKYYHILGSCFPDLESLRFEFPNQRSYEGIYPLVAQPFVEFCLKIPTWQLIDGGLGRGLARRAFQGDLPRKILGRTSKATEHGIFEELFQKNHSTLRQALLDGVLVQNKFFDRRKLERALNPKRDMSKVEDCAMLFDMFGWETWAHRWMN